jgi:hypothetical protein
MMKLLAKKELVCVSSDEKHFWGVRLATGGVPGNRLKRHLIFRA